MTDNSTPQDVAATPGSAPAVSAPVEAPVAPLAEALAAPVPVTESSAATPAPAVKDAAAEPAKADAVTTSVMGDAAPEPAKADAKPDAVKPDTAKADAPAETPPEKAPEAVELPKYELKLPENFTANDQFDAFTKILGEIEIGKLDHAGLQEKGQALVEIGTKAIATALERQTDYYVQIHEQQKQGWFDAFKKDPELGGDKVDQTVMAVREAIDSYGGTPEQIKELRTQMKDSGYGNYPALIRLIKNMQTKINSYTKETASPVVPGQRPAPVKVKDYQRFYGG